MKGHIKLHRALLENKLWTSEPFTKGQAFVDLLLLANHKNGFIKLRNGEIVNISRGECGYSKEALAVRWRWSRGKVSRYLLFLEKSEKMIQQKNIPKATIIAILNYEKYQDNTSNGHQTDTNNNEEKNNTIPLYNTHTLYKAKSDLKNRGGVPFLTQEEYEVLRSYAKKSNARNLHAYVRTLIKNNGYREILDEEYARREILKKQAQEKRELEKREKEEAKKPSGFELKAQKINTKEEAMNFLKELHPKLPFKMLMPHEKQFARNFDISEEDWRAS